MKPLFLILATVQLIIVASEAAKILALFPYKAQSHFYMFDTLLKELATRGHNVFVLGHFPQKKPVPNYTDIDVSDTLPEIIDSMDFELIRSQDAISFPFLVWEEHRDMCEDVLSHTNVKKLLNSQEKFDLIIYEVFGSDCFLGFAHKFKVPFIGVISSVAFSWAHGRIGNPDHPAYISNYYLPYADNMTFNQRLTNAIYGIFINWAYHFHSDIPTYQTAKKYFGPDLPPIWEIAKNTSLILVNSHFSINSPRPAVPGFIEVGGLHVTKASKLPSDLEKYIGEAEHGVVYFSLGSMVRSETLPQDKLASLLAAFSQLPQRIIWRCNCTNVKNLPKNIKAAVWLPQRSILEHPNVKVFITHGGLMGTQEAIYYGVPLVVIPLFGDQFLNAESYASKGIAVKLDYNEITESIALQAIRTALSTKYKEAAKKMSAYFRDRPLSALDTAVFWTEYVIRHGGASHLRSAAVDLPFYQYLLLDVVIFIIAVLASIGYFIYYITRIICHVACRTSTATKQMKKKKQ